VFRVTSDQQSGADVTLKLEGRLAGAWVDEFARELDSAIDRSDRVTLDLDGLSFVDHRGLSVIRGGIGRGARCTGGSEFISTLIEEEQGR
jgi:anti-anti-sigma regulatory factor